jgi:hypothetical protein
VSEVFQDKSIPSDSLVGRETYGGLLITMVGSLNHGGSIDYVGSLNLWWVLNIMMVKFYVWVRKLLSVRSQVINLFQQIHWLVVKHMVGFSNNGGFFEPWWVN